MKYFEECMCCVFMWVFEDILDLLCVVVVGGVVVNVMV